MKDEIQKHNFILIKFSIPDCPSCAALSPKIEKLSEMLDIPVFEHYCEMSKICSKLHIVQFPSLVLQSMTKSHFISLSHSDPLSLANQIDLLYQPISLSQYSNFTLRTTSQAKTKMFDLLARFPVQFAFESAEKTEILYKSGPKEEIFDGKSMKQFFKEKLNFKALNLKLLHKLKSLGVPAILCVKKDKIESFKTTKRGDKFIFQILDEKNEMFDFEDSVVFLNYKKGKVEQIVVQIGDKSAEEVLKQFAIQSHKFKDEI